MKRAPGWTRERKRQRGGGERPPRCPCEGLKIQDRRYLLVRPRMPTKPRALSRTVRRIRSRSRTYTHPLVLLLLLPLFVPPSLRCGPPFLVLRIPPFFFLSKPARHSCNLRPRVRDREDSGMGERKRAAGGEDVGGGGREARANRRNERRSYRDAISGCT